MSIILNELEWAENMERDPDLGKRPLESLSRMAKYYTYIGCGKAESRRRLETLMGRCSSSFTAKAEMDMIESALRFGSKSPLFILDGVEITKPEMERIDSLSSRLAKRLAFTLLCLSKYLNARRGKNDSWVSTPDNEIMEIANIRTSIRRQSYLYSQLKDAGMIRYSHKVDDLSVQVLFAEEGERAMWVTDFRNLGYQYLMYHGEPYFVCESCGLTEKAETPGTPKRRKKKYCSDCAVKIHMRQIMDSVMRGRERERNNNYAS